MSGGTELRLGSDGPAVVTLPAAIGLAQGEAMELGVRPTNISLAETGGIEAEVALIERLGATSLIHARVSGLDPLVTVEQQGRVSLAPGDPVRISFDPNAVHVFDHTGAARR